MAVCKVEHCGQPVHANGRCLADYVFFRRNRFERPLKLILRANRRREAREIRSNYIVAIYQRIRYISQD